MMIILSQIGASAIDLAVVSQAVFEAAVGEKVCHGRARGDSIDE
jgi:hypothetical protein